MTEIKTVVVTYEQFSDYLFNPPGSFFVRMATGDYMFFKSSNRAKCQAISDEYFGKGKYAVVAAKQVKTKSRREDGGFSCTGTATRRGQRK